MKRWIPYGKACDRTIYIHLTFSHVKRLNINKVHLQYTKLENNWKSKIRYLGFWFHERRKSTALLKSMTERKTSLSPALMNVGGLWQVWELKIPGVGGGGAIFLCTYCKELQLGFIRKILEGMPHDSSRRKGETREQESVVCKSHLLAVIQQCGAHVFQRSRAITLQDRPYSLSHVSQTWQGWKLHYLLCRTQQNY